MAVTLGFSTEKLQKVVIKITEITLSKSKLGHASTLSVNVEV